MMKPACSRASVFFGIHNLFTGKLHKLTILSFKQQDLIQTFFMP
jgi:hypothetical protein